MKRARGRTREREINKGGGKLGSRMNNFYVEMDASFMHTMIIPKKFARMLKGSMREIIELEGPSGITWHVKMMRGNNIFALRSGWKDFVTANSIDKNDILVFTYNGTSSFKVLIFDPSGCQKASPFFAKKTETETEKESAPHCEVNKEIISISSGSSDNDDSSGDISSGVARAYTTGERVCGKRKQIDFVQESSESDERKHGTVIKRKTKENRAKKASRLYVVPRRTHLTQAQKEIANRMARKTQKGSDLFVKILTPMNIHTHNGCTLNLPRGFACKILQSKKKKVTLLPADSDKRGKRCTVNYYCKNRSTKRCIGKGWYKFAQINGLKQGDLCLFELRKQDKRGILTMIVHFNHK